MRIIYIFSLMSLLFSATTTLTKSEENDARTRNTCSRNGMACSTPNDCCEENDRCYSRNKIRGRRCQKCKVIGVECERSFHCCSNLCFKGKCKEKPDGRDFVSNSDETDKNCIKSKVELDNDGIRAAVSEYFSNKEEAVSKFGEIETWNINKVTRMDKLFADQKNFNENLGCWNTSSVTEMYRMFYNSSFNGDISNWDVSKVNFMDEMFMWTNEFNVNISGWDVSSVREMSGMFDQATKFNINISSWDVSKVENVRYMFYRATSFAQQLCLDLALKDHEGILNKDALNFMDSGACILKHCCPNCSPNDVPLC